MDLIYLKQNYAHGYGGKKRGDVTKVKRNFGRTLDKNHPIMTNRTCAILTPKATSNRPTALKLLNPYDPNHNAFKLVIAFEFCCDLYFSKKKNSIFGPIFVIPPRCILH